MIRFVLIATAAFCTMGLDVMAKDPALAGCKNPPPPAVLKTTHKAEASCACPCDCDLVKKFDERVARLEAQLKDLDEWRVPELDERLTARADEIDERIQTRASREVFDDVNERLLHLELKGREPGPRGPAGKDGVAGPAGPPGSSDECCTLLVAVLGLILGVGITLICTKHSPCVCFECDDDFDDDDTELEVDY